MAKSVAARCLSTAAREARPPLLRTRGAPPMRAVRCADAGALVRAVRGDAELRRLPHVAVLGRSNAGKSSLLNDVMRRAGAAAASSRAGKTTGVDLFVLGRPARLVLADLPGYPARDGCVGSGG